MDNIFIRRITACGLIRPNVMDSTLPRNGVIICAKLDGWHQAEREEEESEMNVSASVIGLDISKNVFVAVGRDDIGREVFRKKLSRGQVLAFFANAAVARVGIEACAGAHYWARKLSE